MEIVFLLAVLFYLPMKCFRWDRLKDNENIKFIVNNNYFRLLENEIKNSDSSTEKLSKSFISTAFTIADELSITSTEEIRQSFFHISQSIFNLHKIKVKLYKVIKMCNSQNDLDSFTKFITRYYKICLKIHKACNKHRKFEYQH